MDKRTAFSVEVVCALPERCVAAIVELNAGATVAEAIKLSGLAEALPQIGHAPLVAGIFGRRVSLSTEPQAGDRIEIYRPLVADPKQSRLMRARSVAKGTR